MCSRIKSWIHLPIVDSTMMWIKQNANLLSQDHITIVYADEQTSGIGQHGRRWISFPGVGIYATLFLYLEETFPCLQNLGQIFAISCIEVLQALSFHPQIKWPNDLLLNGKKFGGILVETTKTENSWGTSIGIGINVNTTSDQLEILDVQATSLFVISNRVWKIDELLFQIVESFLANLELLKKNGFSAFSKKIEDFLAYLDEEVTFSDGETTFRAICKGIDDLGRLELQHEDGRIDRVYSGSIKLRSDKEGG